MMDFPEQNFLLGQRLLDRGQSHLNCDLGEDRLGDALQGGATASVHWRGWLSIAQKLPRVKPSGVVSGTPRYAATPWSRIARFSHTTGCCVASLTTSGRPEVTT